MSIRGSKISSSNFYLEDARKYVKFRVVMFSHEDVVWEFP